jgi:hypothetical protein
MPDSSKKIFDILGLEIANINDLKSIDNKEFLLKKPENLFNRI